jgi:hypothetical protein
VFVLTFNISFVIVNSYYCNLQVEWLEIIVWNSSNMWQTYLLRQRCQVITLKKSNTVCVTWWMRLMAYK